MALIKCPECGHEISSYADKCIYCGCPMDQIQKLLNGNLGTSVQHNKESLIVLEDGKFLSLLDDNARQFINNFNKKLSEKYALQYTTKENNKSFAFKFAKYPKFLLHFKLVKNSGALKLEYKTTGKKRRLMPATNGKYNLERLLAKLLPELDAFFERKPESSNKSTIQKVDVNEEDNESKLFWDSLGEYEQRSITYVINLINQLSKISSNISYKKDCVVVSFNDYPSEIRIYKEDDELLLKAIFRNGEVKSYPFDTVRSKLGEIIVEIKHSKEVQASNGVESNTAQQQSIGGLWLDLNDKQRKVIIFVIKLFEKRFDSKSSITCAETYISVNYENQTFEMLFTKIGKNILCKLKLANGETKVYPIEMLHKNLGEMVVFILFGNEKVSTVAKIDDSYKYKNYEEEVISENKRRRKENNNDWPLLYIYIYKEIKGKSYFANSAIKTICADISNYVKDTIGYKPDINKKYYSFFDYTFSFGYISYKEIDMFYKYFKASSIISLIESYERIYNKEIIYSKEDLISSLYQKFDNEEEIEFSALKGITSNINLVPETTLEEKIEFFESLENLDL